MRWASKLLSLMQRIYNIIIISAFGSKGQILVFHEICKDLDIINFDSCTCSLSVFEQYVRRHKKNICSLDHLLQNGNSHSIAITFDDTPESVYLQAYPLMCELNIPFVIYISPKFLDEKGFLTRNQLQEMSANPLCTVGAHTMTHPKLKNVKNGFSEINDSKLYLEKIIGCEITHLAYPYGRADSVDNDVRRYAKLAGFKTAVCTIPTKVPQKYNCWYIPRMTLKYK